MTHFSVGVLSDLFCFVWSALVCSGLLWCRRMQERQRDLRAAYAALKERIWAVMQEVHPGQRQKYTTLDAFVWASAIVTSRMLSLKGTVHLVPFADMFNYAPNPVRAVSWCRGDVCCAGKHLFGFHRPCAGVSRSQRRRLLPSTPPRGYRRLPAQQQHRGFTRVSSVRTHTNRPDHT